MKKLLLVSLCFLLLAMTQVYAQNRTITGTVKAKEDGLPLPGVTVKVKGGTANAATNANGKYTISAPLNAVLVFTSIGYLQVETAAPANGVLDVSMEVSSHELSEVAITTAFGVKKESRSLGYAATDIDAKTLTTTEATNFTNGLTAKVPGLVINTTDNSVNPTTRFTLRGNRHINGNNYALVVLNGVPISPNDVNTISPDDIENVDILQGAGAAALYGSEASNGVIIITTKKGSTSGAPTITYSNTYQLEHISYFPNLQTQFGSYGGEPAPWQDQTTGFVTLPTPFENQSYGPLYNGSTQPLGIPLQNGTIQSYPYSTPNPDPRSAFFQTGHAEQNSVSYASGDANNGFNLTANRLDKTGTIPGDTYQRTIVRVSAGHTYGIFHGEFTASYSQSMTSTGGAILSTLYNTPSWVPIENFKDQTQPFADASTYFNSYDVNPYATINNNRNNSRNDTFNGSFTGVITPTKWVDFTYRLADNFGVGQSQNTVREIDYTPYALSDPTGGYGTEASSAKVLLLPGHVANEITFGDGGVGVNSSGPQGFSRLTQDAILNFHGTFFNDFKANLRTGSTIWQEYANDVANNSSNLFIKDFYNINYISGVPTTSQTSYKIRQISYFADGSVSYKNWAFLDATLRNEHDSRLNDAQRSIWFPSVNASFVLTDAIPALKNNKQLSYLKIRATYAKVGDVNIGAYGYTPNNYSLTNGFPYGNLTALTLGTNLNNPSLRPEITKEVEFGLDLGMFDGMITGGVTYYNNHTTDQTISISTSPTIGYSTTTVNVGDVQNQGFEFHLDVQPLTKAKNKVGLDLSGNFSIQNSKVISLLNGLNSVSLANGGLQALVGYPYPELVASDVNRDPSGHVIVNASTGYPSTNPVLQNLGRTTPKYILGLTQQVSYKFVTLTLTSEFRTGYVIQNQNLSAAVAAGTAGYSATNGRSRFIFPNSVINTGTAAAPVYTPNTNVAVQDGNVNFWDNNAFYSATSTYVESGAFWKLREAALAFDLSSFVKQTKAIKRASFAINGRNLIMLRPKTNDTIDPESSNTSGNAVGLSGTTTAPPSRIYGGTLTLTF